jgi:hypothetical protein
MIRRRSQVGKSGSDQRRLNRAGSGRAEPLFGSA